MLPHPSLLNFNTWKQIFQLTRFFQCIRMSFTLMCDSMNDAAKNGNIDDLYALIRKDVKLLDLIDERSFARTPLHVAACAGQIQFAKEIMRLKPSFGKKLDEDGFSPIHVALQEGHSQLALQLLEGERDLVRVKGREGITPLHYAAKVGDVDLLFSFLSACTKSIEDVTIQNETALHISLKNGMFRAFEVLLRWLKEGREEEARYRERLILNWKDEQGNTVLHIAAFKYQSEALRLLLDCRVDRSLKNAEGQTAWDIINSQGNFEDAEVIEKLTIAKPSSFPPVDECGHYLRHGEWLKNAAEEGDVNALYAITREDPNLLEQIDQVALVDTPLHIASSAGHSQFALEIMRLKPSFARKLNPDGLCPIHLALQRSHFQLVLMLIALDSDLVRLRGREGKTPLHYVVQIGDLQLLAIFLSFCPKSIEDKTFQDETVLHIAVKNNNVGAFEFLIDRLHWECSKEARYIEENILEWQDKQGNTVLHIAASRNQIKLVRLLIDCKVNLNVINLEGRTALDISQDEIRTEIMDMLIGEGAKNAYVLPTKITPAQFLTIEQRLTRAAKDGDIDALHSIIWYDQYILERIDRVPFFDSPLHIAARRGHAQFAMEIMWLKPSFARKLNREGYSPLHLALQYNHTQTVRRFIDVDSYLVRIRGGNGLTPLHHTAKLGMLDLLAEFLVACPRSIEDLTVHKETALHIAAKNDRSEAVEVLVGWLEHAGRNNILDWTDDEGNTLLHIASQRNQLNVVNMLTDAADWPLPIRMLLKPKADLNVKNCDGSTVVQILLRQGQLDKNKLGAIRGLAKVSEVPSFSEITSYSDYLRRRITGLEKWAVGTYREKVLMSNETRNAVLVVAILIATATYQAVLNPPGGFSQASPTSFTSNGTLPTRDSTSNANNSTDSIYLAGNLLYTDPTSTRDLVFWTLFVAFNTIAFLMSLIKIMTLLPRGPYIFLPLVLPLICCYGIFIIYISPNQYLLPLLLGLFIIPACFFLTKWTIDIRLFRRRRWAVKQLLSKHVREPTMKSQAG
ncbi:hypothetical protein K2173_017667 [Erythroxylum novogranatense]|uniref:PGG domain-containing protein n=1 Tax=Erythroxylum novogranatense TaxID=1862640 RepID=A0AAV8T1Q4_9ROSI|nr:hypothetical protein K2173_017667 [Erythroxylum novogranatense]